jgi:FkbM family methyltransferase
MYNVPGFADQKPVNFTFFDYSLKAPSGHVLLSFCDPRSRLYQPYRETGLVKIIKSMPRDCNATVIDIGANIGDTCAIIHRHSDMKILCVEASDFFFPYLAKNVECLFRDRAVARHAFVVATTEEAPKGLYHWGGTARAIDAPFSESCQVVTISQLLDSVQKIALLKIDIDGPDLELISAAFDNSGIDTPQFPIYFEYDCAEKKIDTMRANCAKLLAFFRKAAEIGYLSAFLWDDPGRFFGLVDVRSEASIINAINYMGHLQHRSIYGYDVCLVHRSDVIFASTLCNLISRDAIVPLSIAWSF